MLLINLMFAFFNLYAGLPELSTKQSLSNIRFVSQDGKITYYQARSGSLSLTSNYQNKVVLKNDKNTNYQIHSTSSRKMLAISVDKTFHDEYNLLKANEIYTAKFGFADAILIGKGVSPKLHIGDNFISYYRAIEKEIIIKSVFDKDEKRIIIPIVNKVNPYFVPEVVMLSPTIILFTDLNKVGKTGILKYDLISKKFTSVFKSSFNGTKIELCKNGNSLFIAQFSYPTLKRGSKIERYNIRGKTGLGKPIIIYESSSEDPGNISCFNNQDKLYFVKEIEIGKGKKKTEVAEINLKSKSLSIVSDLKYVTQIISMDGRVLAPLREKFYVISGENDLNKDKFKNKDKKKKAKKKL